MTMHSVSLVYCYWLFSERTHVCGHVVYVFPHITFSYESWAFANVTPLGCMTCFRSFDWLRDMAHLTRTGQLMDFT